MQSYNWKLPKKVLFFKPKNLFFFLSSLSLFQTFLKKEEGKSPVTGSTGRDSDVRLAELFFFDKLDRFILKNFFQSSLTFVSKAMSLP